MREKASQDAIEFLRHSEVLPPDFFVEWVADQAVAAPGFDYILVGERHVPPVLKINSFGVIKARITGMCPEQHGGPTRFLFDEGVQLIDGFLKDMAQPAPSRFIPREGLTPFGFNLFPIKGGLWRQVCRGPLSQSFETEVAGEFLHEGVGQDIFWLREALSRQANLFTHLLLHNLPDLRVIAVMQ